MIMKIGIMGCELLNPIQNLYISIQLFDPQEGPGCQCDCGVDVL